MRDVRRVTESTPKLLELFLNGELVSSISDRPWADYYCCMLAGNNAYIRNHPTATKSVLRAILKAADICASDPRRAARRVIERKADDDYDNALRTMREIPYIKWREHDSADTMRFLSLRLHQAGMIKSTSNKIIAEGTDWRFLDEVKRELKG